MPARPAPHPEPRLAAIQRFPVKGLSAESLERVSLAAGAMLPGDRRFALVYGDPSSPGGRPRFAALKSEPRLAELDSRYDAASGELVLSRRGRPVARGVITEPIGKTLIDQFLLSFLGAGGRGAVRLIEAEAGAAGFGDTGGGHVSLLNLASVRDLERVTRAPVDPRRFRANFWIEGLPPWVERGWAHRDLTLGPVRLHGIEPIERCSATNVDPETAQVDMNLPLTLKRAYGHAQFGLYCRALTDGELAIGDRLEPPVEAAARAD
ncbi:hypothetical protein SAMN06265365_111157 [Tistlia consotensis]|uniref:MOSC domain-containing protein n=1 Tax=Tistlia consotensis USBA 355 TaxID=560819 RepID=A0A1Y6BXC5_9PROT|nr:MOSC domain-containing protein [Tistlia consotensis]SMF33762.1 hypothetical protein SAMN05428998_111159 [Tistlia consotensis USBA 355]SNR70321.1 hypothetical protein SAMN06265365_111157 [Tistlia consotensis]